MRGREEEPRTQEDTPDPRSASVATDAGQHASETAEAPVSASALSAKLARPSRPDTFYIAEAFAGLSSAVSCSCCAGRVESTRKVEFNRKS